MRKAHKKVEPPRKETPRHSLYKYDVNLTEEEVEREARKEDVMAKRLGFDWLI